MQGLLNLLDMDLRKKMVRYLQNVVQCGILEGNANQSGMLQGTISSRNMGYSEP